MPVEASQDAARAPAEWVEVRATVDARRARDLDAFLEPLCAVARTLSPGGVVIEGDDAPPGPLPPPPPGHARVRVWVPAPTADEAVALVRGVVDGGGYVGGLVETAPLDPDWRERWKEGFRGFRATRRLWIRPPWEEPSPGDAVDVVIEPGMAFGTGQHETTRLCLDAVEAMTARPGGAPESLLDLGCGTGIVSIAAARLGVPRVRGVDISPDAIRAARENAQRNGLDGGPDEGALRFERTALERLDGVYPVVVVNILAHILKPLRDQVVARVAPGGELFVTGLMGPQEEPMSAAFSVRGLALVGRAQRGDWVRLDFRRAG